jgi:hypothetical protein
VQDEKPACLKNGGFFKTSQLTNGGFAHIDFLYLIPPIGWYQIKKIHH